MAHGQSLQTGDKRKKPFLHILITDVIIFGPVIAIILAVVDVIVSPAGGWGPSLQFAGTAFMFALVGAKMRTLGISLDYHRQGTHPTYQTKPWLRAIFFGCSS